MPRFQPHFQHTSQQQSLEKENQRLRQQLQELTREASHNEEVLKKYHERELALLATETLPQLLENLTIGMQRSFRLPCVSLVLHDPDHEFRHLLSSTGIQPESFEQAFFVDQLADFSPIYNRLKRAWLGPFLGQDHNMLFPGCRTVRSVALLPLIRHNTLVGGLNLGSGDPFRFTRHHASDFLHRLATIGAVCLENSLNREHLVLSGLTDALTGLHNRRYLERRLHEEVARSHRYSHPLSCLFIDADHFKRVNDLHGHSAGDQVLREISLRVKECLRASDVATRFGGEEFALLLPQTDAMEAVSLAERIRKRIAHNPVPIGDNEEIGITVSIGVSQLDQNNDPEEAGKRLISSADGALYEAKRRGRDQVRCAPLCV